MKYVKIIAGILLLLGAGSEYANAGKQLLTYFNPGILIACLGMILLAAWLIGKEAPLQPFFSKPSKNRPCIQRQESSM
ncbi:MAG TPA: hypothetical protein PLZ45_10000 [Ferruginibacter sp.]|nr:hypothetical protein [Ferruginibacter sp.]